MPGSSPGGMMGEELAWAAIGELRGFVCAALAEVGGETVVQPLIVVKRDLGVIVQTLMHRLLRILVDEAVFGRNMQEQGIGDRVLSPSSPSMPTP